MKYTELPEEKREKLKQYQRDYQKNKRANMTEEERQKKREYLQKYREVNRQKINEYALNWKYNQSKEGAEKRKGKWAAMTQEEKDKYNEKKRQRYKIWYFLLDDDKKRKLIDVSRRWIDNNKELHAEMNKQYYQQNKKKKDESGKVPTTQPG
jgi:hypothetical protein